MARRVAHALHDILEAIERVEDITRGKSLGDFEASWQLRWLVQRANEIISEASRAIPDELTGTEPGIPWRKARGIGNVLRHDYEGLSDRIIWNVVLDELPRGQFNRSPSGRMVDRPEAGAAGQD
ncbi:MAG: DUF86 domain-containing protein [Xanthobacteraceae bacterium]|nr:DUF86 domain-containing protein [Xanthobacteraceae bacterium]